MHIAQGDSVIVIAGKDKGKKGTVLRVLREQNRVIVAGINMVTKHVKRTAQSEGRAVRLEHSLHASNVMILDPKTGKPTRIRSAIDPKTKHKIRVAVRSGTPIERARLTADQAEKADADAVVTKEQVKAKKATKSAPFWKKSSAAASADGSKTKADAGPASATVTHTRSAGRGS